MNPTFDTFWKIIQARLGQANAAHLSKSYDDTERNISNGGGGKAYFVCFQLTEYE